MLLVAAFVAHVADTLSGRTSSAEISGMPMDTCSSLVWCSKSAICSPHLHLAIRGAQEVLPMMVRGATRQLDLPSVTPLSVACCGRLQQGVPIGQLH